MHTRSGRPEDVRLRPKRGRTGPNRRQPSVMGRIPLTRPSVQKRLPGRNPRTASSQGSADDSRRGKQDVLRRSILSAMAIQGARERPDPSGPQLFTVETLPRARARAAEYLFCRVRCVAGILAVRLSICRSNDRSICSLYRSLDIFVHLPLLTKLYIWQVVDDPHRTCNQGEHKFKSTLECPRCRGGLQRERCHETRLYCALKL